MCVFEMPSIHCLVYDRWQTHTEMCLSRFIAGWNGSESNFQMSYEALSTYIRAETSVFLQVCLAEERDVLNRGMCVGELIVNIGGLRRQCQVKEKGEKRRRKKKEVRDFLINDSIWLFVIPTWVRTFHSRGSRGHAAGREELKTITADERKVFY